MSKILVVGSSNTDMVVKTERFPQPGETIIGGHFFMFPGGKGANQAVAAARLAGDVTFVCKVGNDIFGKNAVEGFVKEGINTDYIFTDPTEPSGVALITVNAQGQNEIVVASGANGTLSESDITKIIPQIDEASIVLMQLETPLSTVEFVSQWAAQKGKKVILNPAPAQKLPEKFYKSLYLITPNETETQILTGIQVTDSSTALQAAELLRRWGVQNVIITMGASGVFVLTDDFTGQISAPIVKAVDTTAAGDVFNGALAVALAKGRGWEEACQFACRAASISVTRMGAQASAPYLHELILL
ncbi:MAG: ribokinase [Runella sp.]